MYTHIIHMIVCKHRKKSQPTIFLHSLHAISCHRFHFAIESECIWSLPKNSEWKKNKRERENEAITSQMCLQTREDEWEKGRESIVTHKKYRNSNCQATKQGKQAHQHYKLKRMYIFGDIKTHPMNMLHNVRCHIHTNLHTHTHAHTHRHTYAHART